MKKPKLFFVLFLFLLNNATFAQKKDKREVLRDSICLEVHLAGYDSSFIGHFFDSTIFAYRIRKIYFIGNVTGYSHYLYRTMLIDEVSSKTFLQKFIGELAHAKQAKDYSVRYLKSTSSTIINSTLKSIFNRRKYKLEAEKKIVETGWSRFKAYWWAAFQSVYDDPESFEYEAHQIIEPKLWDIVLSKLIPAKQKLILAGTE